LAALALVFFAACASDHFYLNTDWGMSEKSLRAARPGSAAAGERLRVEHAAINGHKAEVTYRLGAKGLQSVTIVLDPVPMTKDQYIDVYHQVRALLSEKYGAPGEEAADLAVRSQKIRIPQVPDYQSQCLFRTPLALIELSCAGACDGTVDNGVIITYEAPRAPTEGL
jgi:hypothetical protein